jgi:RNA polymerase sigma-70 factor, ECF subfamily
MTTPTPANAPSPATAFVAELSQHRQYLVHFARRRLHDDAQAEDSVQETLLAALQGHAAFDHRASLRTWLTGILLRRISDSLRQQGRRPSVGGSRVDECDEDGDATPSDETVDWVDPQRRLEGRQFLHDLQACLAELQPPLARLFTLREIDGLDNGQAAAAMGLSARQSTLLWHRARQQLRQRLAPHGSAPAPRCAA